jgi:glycosyltransferase involved in cell wall biosynthesis
MDISELNILLVISKMGKGGAQRIVLDLANWLAAKGANVDLLLFYRTGQDISILAELDPRVDLISLTPFRLKKDHESSLQKAFAIALFPLLTFWWAFTNKLGKYHIVHSNLLMASIFAWFCSLFRFPWQGPHPKFVETFHADLHSLRAWEKNLFFFLWKRMDLLIVELRKNDIELIKRRVSAGSMAYIPFGIQPLAMPDCEQLQNARDITAGVPVILSVSRINQQEKRALDLLRVIHRLSEIYPLPFLFVLVGDGPDSRAAQDLVESLGISKYVRFTGYLDDFRSLSVISKAFLIAGVEDLVGIAGLQAASLGAPIVSFQMDPDWKSSQGTFYNSRSYDELANELKRLLTDSSYQQNASKYAASVVRELFSVERMAAATAEQYISLLKGM